MLLGGLLTHDGCGMLLAGGQKHLACARTCPSKSSCRSSGGAWGWQRGVCWASSNDPASFSELWIFRTIIVFGWSMINEWMSGMSWTFRLINFHGSQIHASPILDQFSHSQIVLDLSLSTYFPGESTDRPCLLEYAMTDTLMHLFHPKFVCVRGGASTPCCFALGLPQCAEWWGPCFWLSQRFQDETAIPVKINYYR